MQLEDFDFHLPAELIARYPLAQRTASRLLSIHQTPPFQERQFYQLKELLHPGDLLVFNDTRVIPARLFGHKKTGGQVEVLVERILDESRFIAQLRVSKAPKIGDELLLPSGIRLRILGREQAFYELHYSGDYPSILEAIEAIGQTPLPHYMNRTPEEKDKERYQTVYAQYKGSVAAPTAGLHFDIPLLQALREAGIEMAYLTLHIGAGTFQPVRTNVLSEHKMHREYFELSSTVVQQIQETKARGKRVIAVGTTSLRALESASLSGETKAFHGETDIFIYPGFNFQCVDALITNLHLPRSTLLMLVCAFGGYETLMAAYQHAVQNAYRFYSYGDAMWIDRATS